MENNRLIALHQLCEVYDIEISFVYSLKEYGLIQIVHSDEGEFLEEETLSDMERLMRLHYDLDINFAGLDVINHLLRRLHQTQKELVELKNRFE